MLYVVLERQCACSSADAGTIRLFKLNDSFFTIEILPGIIDSNMQDPLLDHYLCQRVVEILIFHHDHVLQEPFKLALELR